MNLAVKRVLPTHFDLYYGGQWHRPAGGYAPTLNPSNQRVLAEAAEANTADVDAAVRAAQQGFLTWKKVPVTEKSSMLREIVRRLRANAHELVLLDSPTGAQYRHSLTSSVVRCR